MFEKVEQGYKKEAEIDKLRAQDGGGIRVVHAII